MAINPSGAQTDLSEHFIKTEGKFEYSVKDYGNLKTAVNGASRIIVTYKAKVVSEAYETPDNLKNVAYFEVTTAFLIIHRALKKDQCKSPSVIYVWRKD